MSSFTFIAAGPIVGKGRPKFTTRGGYGRAYTPKKTEEYEEFIRKCFYEKYPEGTFERIDIDPVALTMNIFTTPPKSTSKKKKDELFAKKLRPMVKPDIDNVIKIVADSLNGIAYRDDVQIVDITVSRYFSDTAKLVISVEKV